MRQRPPADESGHAIVDFLDEHRLPHSPENYGFAHTYFEGADEAHFMAVANLIDGGYRLRQEDVRAISAPARAGAAAIEADKRPALAKNENKRFAMLSLLE